MLFIGITGGVGAGKSAILDYLKTNYNCKVMLTDEIAHDVMEPGTDCYAKLQEIFGEDPVWLADGHFDRPALAKVLFTDDSKRETLNGVVHPAVHEMIRSNYEQAVEEGKLSFLVLESALLLDGNNGEMCDEMWYIYTSEANRRQRLKDSRGYSDAKIDSIMASQKPEAEFRARCAEVIDNNGTPEESFAQIREILKKKGIV